VIDQNTRNGGGTDVARCLLHSAVDGLEGGDRDPDHVEERPHQLDHHHTPESADEVEVEEDAGDGDEEPKFWESLTREEREEQQIAHRKAHPRKGVSGWQADHAAQERHHGGKAEAHGDRAPHILPRQRRAPVAEAELLGDDGGVPPDIGEGPGSDDDQREDDDEREYDGEEDTGPVDPRSVDENGHHAL
jgi:hypothetical protein